VTKGQKQVWSISLTIPVRVSYFAIRFTTSRIFNHLEEEILQLTKASQLTGNLPIRAEIAVHNYNKEKISCEIYKVIEASDWVTQISFKCDELDTISNHEYYKN